MHLPGRTEGVNTPDAPGESIFIQLIFQHALISDLRADFEMKFLVFVIVTPVPSYRFYDVLC